MPKYDGQNIYSQIKRMNEPVAGKKLQYGGVEEYKKWNIRMNLTH